jgi:hypothetical protein
MTLLDGMTPAFVASGRVQYMSLCPDLALHEFSAMRNHF